MKARPTPADLFRTAQLLALALCLAACSLLGPGPLEYEPRLLESGVWVRDLVVPDAGPEARDGDRLQLHYRMTLADGTEVDSSFDRGQPIEVRLGDGQLPIGLEEGIHGMRLYGRRELLVPSELAFGLEGRPPRIPPAADLHCLLELVGLDLEP